MIDLSKVRNFYVACGYTDLRFGIDGLAAVANAVPLRSGCLNTSPTGAASGLRVS